MWRLALALALAAPAAGAADAPRAELFGGYSHARHDSQETDGFLTGLDLSLGRSFGLELAVTRHYDSELGTSVSWTSLQAGPRYAWRGDRVTPFVSIQAGVERRQVSAEVFDVRVSLTDTTFAGAVTAGADLAVASHWAVRAQGAYAIHDAYADEQAADGPDEGFKGDPQLALAVVFRFGKR